MDSRRRLVLKGRELHWVHTTWMAIKQVLNSESILWGVLFWFLYALSFRPAGDHETLRGGK